MAMREDLVRDTLLAAGGTIVGRIRLQKILYLLEQFGLDSGFRFSYHHYGPYSEEISSTVMRAEYIDKLITEKEEVTSYGNPYSVFRSLTNEPLPNSLGKLPFDKARILVEEMKAESSVVLELAATIHWLKEKEGIVDWQSELRSRKPTKATPDQMNKALGLLNRLTAEAEA